MLDIVERCFPDQLEAWGPKIKELVPSYGTKLGEKPSIAERTLKRTANVLELTA